MSQKIIISKLKLLQSNKFTIFTEKTIIMESEEERKEIHDVAWATLTQKGLNLGERLNVRSAFVTWSGYKEQNPFIKHDKSSDRGYYHSTHTLIDSLMFETEEEVVLANAIYLNMDKSCGVDNLIQMFIYTGRIIGLNSKWCL